MNNSEWSFQVKAHSHDVRLMLEGAADRCGA